MYQKIIINIFLLVGLAIVQLAFIGSLPPPANAFNIAIIVLVWLLPLSSYRTVIWWSAGIGVLFDLYSFLPFGTHLLSLLGALALGRWLLLDFFTNRSLYSYLALTFFTTLTYEVSWQAVAAFVLFISGEPANLDFGADFWAREGYLIGLNMAGVAAIFYAYGFISHKLKPTFLFKANE